MSQAKITVGSKPKNVGSTSRRLLEYVGQNRTLLMVVIVLSLVTTIMALIGTYAVDPIVSYVEKAFNGTITVDVAFTGIIRLIIILMIIYVVEIALTYIAQLSMVRVSQMTVRKIREELFAKVVRIPVPYHDRYSHGELMSRFTNDMDLVSEALNQSAASLVNNFLLLIGTIVVMMILSPVLATITIIIIPLLTLMTNKIVRYSRRYSKAQQDSLGKLSGNVEESIEGQAVLQLFNHEAVAFEQFRGLNRGYRLNAQKAQGASGMMFPLMANLNNINYAIMGIVGGWLIIHGYLGIPALTAFVGMTKQLGRPINEMAMQFTTLQSALASCERIFEVIDWPNEIVSANEIALDEVHGEVRFEHVVFGYVPQTVVLKDISFYAHPGQKIAFVGSTGAGKTTITNLITRFYEINSGAIVIDGHPISELNRFSIRKHTAMVLQDTHLFSGSVMENIRYGNLDASDEDCQNAAHLANADVFIEQLENGYDTLISADGEELSQGQRQLLNIARALIANPEILILDEATSSIDTRTERLIEKGMDKLMEGRTTFVIAHRLSTVRNSDAILVIEHGEIIERGSHEELLAMGGRYADLYTGQSKLE